MVAGNEGHVYLSCNQCLTFYKPGPENFPEPYRTVISMPDAMSEIFQTPAKDKRKKVRQNTFKINVSIC